MKALDDTIVAIATAPGEGAIAVLRLSGPRSGELGGTILRDRGGGRLHFSARGVWWARALEPESGRLVDEVLALWMPGPASYTREDVLEIQCHGGQSAAGALLRVLVSLGARLAEPGEFTLRAYVGGRIDLVQAEAVLDVIRAQTGQALEVHSELLKGGLSEEVGEWQRALGRVLARIEATLDFGEEEVGGLAGEEVEETVRSVMGFMTRKLAGYTWGRTAREGFRVVLVGAPNTGKSSLLNRLAQEEHAIVSATPGTTRDAIEVRMNALGVPIRLVDTAGLRGTGDEVEDEGVRRAVKLARGADLLLWVCDGSREFTREEAEALGEVAAGGAVRAVLNKIDVGQISFNELVEQFGREPIPVSALTGEGLEQLLEAVREAAWAGGGPGTEGVVLTRERHRAAVEAARGCLERALRGLEGGAYPELVARELQGARGALAELVGGGAVDEVLEAIFSEFCIGK